MSIQTIEGYASQALTCSQQMYLLAEQEDWEALSKVETERSQILHSLFDHSAMPALLSRIAEPLRRIIELDQKIIALGKQARETLKGEMELLKLGKRAVDAYLGNSA